MHAHHNEGMKVITVRNVPDDLHRALSRLAARNRRSLQQQALVLLDRARRLDRDSPLEAAQSIRKRLAGRELGDSVAEVREDRER
jgi:plasmid stability protein